MITVTDPSELVPRAVFDRSEIDRLRWFQVERYFDAGLLDQLPVCLGNDPSVDQSTYFGVYDGCDIQATARIVRATTGLPMLDHHVLYPHFEDLVQSNLDTVAEISRLAVGKSTTNYRALELLSREFLRFGLRNQYATILIASVEKPLVRILSRTLGVPLQIIGPPIEKYGSYNGECTPIMIEPIECLLHFQNKRSRLWEFFTEDLEIDLRETADKAVTADDETTEAVQVTN